MTNLMKFILLAFLTTLSFAKVAPDYNTALAMSAKENKPIVLTVVITNCPWCHKMQDETFKTPSVAQKLQDQFITLILNKDTDTVPPQLKAKVVPATFFLNAKGEKITHPAIGFFGAQDFNDFLTEALTKYKAK